MLRSNFPFLTSLKTFILRNQSLIFLPDFYVLNKSIHSVCLNLWTLRIETIKLPRDHRSRHTYFFVTCRGIGNGHFQLLIMHAIMWLALLYVKIFKIGLLNQLTHNKVGTHFPSRRSVNHVQGLMNFKNIPRWKCRKPKCTWI